MSLGEIKLVVLIALALVLLVLGGYVGYHFTAQHFQLQIDAAQHASDAALAAAQQRVTTAQTAQKAAEDREEATHAQQVLADNAARAQLDSGVRSVTAALRSLTLPTPVANPGGGLGAAAGTGSGGAVQPGRAELDAAFAEFAAASDNLVGACQHDSREIAGALSVQPKP